MRADRIAANFERIRGEIAEAARRAGRDPGEVRLVAVTKRHPAEWVRPLIATGARDLGENYPQELWEKADALADRADLRWHLIGHLQTNKIRRTLPLIRFVHAVDSPKLLGAVDDWLGATPDHPLEVCLQVNTSAEESKHGWGLDDRAGLIEALTRADPRARVVGLMTIAGYGTTDSEARPMFERLRLLRDDLRTATGVPLPHLSMGMSGDFAAAIAEGSTLVRIGSALFEGADDP